MDTWAEPPVTASSNRFGRWRSVGYWLATAAVAKKAAAPGRLSTAR